MLGEEEHEEGEGAEEMEGEGEDEEMEGEEKGDGEEEDDEESYSDSTSGEDCGFEMQDVQEFELDAVYWSGWDIEPIDMDIKCREIVVRGHNWASIFGEKPDRSQYDRKEDWLQQWFTKAVIVVQPKVTRSLRDPNVSN